MFDTHSAIVQAQQLGDPVTRIGMLTGLMAAVMVDRVAIGGSCTQHDLVEAGFTTAEIIELHTSASKTAAEMMLKQIERRQTVNGPLEAWQALRDVIAAAEEAGWDTERGRRRQILERGRAGLQALKLIFDIKDEG